MSEIPNRQWKFLIVDLAEGTVEGTDDSRIASSHAFDTDMLVVDTQTTKVMVISGEELLSENIPEQTLYKF